MTIHRPASAVVLAFVLMAGTACERAEPPAPPEPPLPVTRLPLPVNDDVKLDLLFRRDFLPQVRRDTPLRLVVDLADQPDLVAISREAEATTPSRAQRKKAVAEALARGVPASRALAAELRKMPGVTDVAEASCLARIAFTGPARLARELAARPDVAWVWGRTLAPVPRAAEPVARPPGEGEPWGPVALRAPEAWARGYRGKGAHACVMDSAPASEPAALAGRRAREAQDAPGTKLPDDGHGHGFAVLGSAVGAGGLGVAPDATWSIVNPLGGGVLDPEVFAASVDWLLQQARPDVVIMPWDVPETVPAYQLAIPVGALRAAGIAVAFPAGNSGPVSGANRPPANLVGLAPDGAPAFSVGGVDEDLGAYDVSNRGPNARDRSQFPIVCAPAAGVAVVDPEGGGVREGNGTSQAVGFAGGALALVMAARPEMTGPQAEALLRDTARDLGPPGPDSTFGHGLIDVAAALGLGSAAAR